MLNEMEITPGMYMLIESDNCTSQHKSAKSFYDMQELAKKYNKFDSFKWYSRPW